MEVKDFFDNVKILGYERNDDEKKELLKKLKEVHNRNFVWSRLSGYVVKIELEYKTSKDNIKTRYKYCIMNLDKDLDIDLEYQAEIMCENLISIYNVNHYYNELKDFKVKGVEIICEVGLDIGG